ncbi:MAG: hypothetical protein KY466_02790 [Gemmatimonadetes bacterium]|nr:hypothetical protein [Gemmatimonadota bacterium]
MSAGRPPDAPYGPEPRPRRSTRSLYARVLIVQALTLIALWLLQQTFGGG